MLKLLRKLFFRYIKRRRFVSLELVEDNPLDLCSNTIYVLGKPYPWSLVFICPCGCNQAVELNLIEEICPCWKYKIDYSGRITIYPSINLALECGAHFSIKDSRVLWYAHI